MDEEKLNKLREVTRGGGQVTPHVSLSNSAIIASPAIAVDNAEILGKAEVHGYSKIREFAKVIGKAAVWDSNLYGHARIMNNARVERSFVSGTAEIIENAYVSGSSISGNAIIAGDAELIGCRIGCNARILDSARLYNVDFIAETEEDLGNRIVVEGDAELDFEKPMSLYPGTRVHEGYWKRPPFVIDTPVFTMTEGVNDRVQIGCQNHSIKFWYEKGKNILLEYGLEEDLYRRFLEALNTMVEYKKQYKSPTRRRRKKQ